MHTCIGVYKYIYFFFATYNNKLCHTNVGVSRERTNGSSQLICGNFLVDKHLFPSNDIFVPKEQSQNLCSKKDEKMRDKKKLRFNSECDEVIDNLKAGASMSAK
ncbi:unnamed protein product [Ceratitis capitata]|uniref:(Mediterranean fruit fly) hypothetical protein n=1 Tax=Ceratitis capitata TaxID=7213 RepID=A0A811U7G3_CERCA|nr:unnamed protein product [Ceratitis capitata]